MARICLPASDVKNVLTVPQGKVEQHTDYVANGRLYFQYAGSEYLGHEDMDSKLEIKKLTMEKEETVMPGAGFGFTLSQALTRMSATGIRWCSAQKLPPESRI